MAERLARENAAAGVPILAPSKENLETWKNHWKESTGKRKRSAGEYGAGDAPLDIVQISAPFGTTLKPDATPCVGWTETQEWHERDCASSIIICQAKYVQVSSRQP